MAKHEDKAGRSRPRRAKTVATGEGAESRTSYTSFVLYPDQLAALKLVAVRHQAMRGAGKADQSEVLRLALDAIATGGEFPEGLKEALAQGLKERRRSG
jgi:hypothetical protein